MILLRFLAIGLSLSLLIGCDDNNNNSRQSTNQDDVTLEQQSLRLPSSAKPAARTPGTPGVAVDNPLLQQQFGPNGPDLNQALYTRYFLSDAEELQPDAILVLMPGFEGGSSNFAPLADQLMRRMRDETAMVLEVWARKNAMLSWAWISCSVSNSGWNWTHACKRILVVASLPTMTGQIWPSWQTGPTWCIPWTWTRW
jgi:hypothetical protein